MVRAHGRLLPLWVMTAAYAFILGWRWPVLPHRLVIHFSAMDEPLRSLPRAGFAMVTLLVLCAAVALASYLLPHPGECSRAAATFSFGFGFGMTGFLAGVFWSLVRTNAGLGSPVRPAVALGLALAALGLVLGVSAPAPLPAHLLRSRMR